jgi:hypothetical protein
VTPGGRDPELMRAIGLVTGIGAIFGGSLVAGLAVGLLVDHFIGGGVLVVAGGLVLGAGGGGASVYRTVMRSIDRR